MALRLGGTDLMLIPAELRGLSWAVQPHWPDGDEAALRRCAHAWRDAAGALRAQLPDADRAGGRALAALRGPPADAAPAPWGTYTVRDPGHGQGPPPPRTHLAH